MYVIRDKVSAKFTGREKYLPKLTHSIDKARYYASLGSARQSYNYLITLHQYKECLLEIRECQITLKEEIKQ